jgi:hypothetical protein
MVERHRSTTAGGRSLGVALFPRLDLRAQADNITPKFGWGLTETSGGLLTPLPFAKAKRGSSTASRARQKAAGEPRTRDSAQNDGQRDAASAFAMKPLRRIVRSPKGGLRRDGPARSRIGECRSTTFRGNARSKPRTLPKHRGRVRHPKKLTPEAEPPAVVI